MRAVVPNTFTSLNLLCGLLGIVFAFNEMLEYSGMLILIAAVFDFFDGFSARMLNAKSAIGKELDSLADVVSFGVLPGIMLFQFINIGNYQYYTPLFERDLSFTLMAGTAFILPIFSALRLAKFNVDSNQSSEFIGLATPAAAIFVASIGLIMGFQLPVNMYYPPTGTALAFSMGMYHQDMYDMWMFGVLFNPISHLILALILSALLVIPIPMFSLKLKCFSWKQNKTQYVFLIFCALFIFYAFAHFFFRIPGSITIEYSSFAWIIIIYVLISIFQSIFRKNEVQS